MLFAWLWVHLLDKGLRVTVMAVDSFSDAIPIHWKELPHPWITNLGSTDFSHFVNACFPWIFTTKWSLCFCRNQMMGLITTEVKLCTGGSYFLAWWSWEGIKGESQDSIQTPFNCMEKDEETCYEWSVSWNNETNLLGKKWIHPWLYSRITADPFPFMINVSNAISYPA